MKLVEIENRIKEAFDLEIDSATASNVLLVRAEGLDNLSLSTWIKEEFPEVEIEVEPRKIYEFSDFGWIKVELKNVVDKFHT